MEDLVLKIALIGGLGIGAQWLSWRFQWPAIVLLLLAGVIAGPLTGILEPATDFGAILRPVIAVAVAIILFEGGLSLNFAEIRETSNGVRRMVLVAAPLAFVFGSLAAHHVAGLSWPTALVFGGILVVTGPTVIMPLLRQARLSPRAASLLRWEAILADPLGAILAVLMFEAYLVFGQSHAASDLVMRAVLALTLALIGGYLFGRLVIRVFVGGQVPEFLKAPGILAAVLVAYAASDLVLEESGLLTVTVMGVTLGNSRLASLTEVRRFKELMTILLVSGVFVVLTATLEMEDILALGARDAAFLVALLFVVRPLSVLLATIGSALPLRERLLVAWIAPRGVVAVAVAGLFGTSLADLGVADGSRLIPLAFAVVSVTVVLHGFSIVPLARALGLASAGPQGVLVAGASPWALAFANKLKEIDLPVMIADNNWNRLKAVRLANVPVYYGEILSEIAEHQIEFNRFGYLVAATDNDSYNALICTDFGPELGRGNVFEVGRREDDRERHDLSPAIGGRPLLPGMGGIAELNRRLAEGWGFQSTQLSEAYSQAQYLADRPQDTVPVCAVRGTGTLVWNRGQGLPELKAGAVIISFGPKPRKSSETRAGQDKVGQADPDRLPD